MHTDTPTHLDYANPLIDSTTANPFVASPAFPNNYDIQFSHTVSGGSRLLIVTLAKVNTTGLGNPAVKFNNVSLTNLNVPNRTNIAVFYLIAPPVGTYTVQVTETREAGSALQVTALSLKNVDQVDSIPVVNEQGTTAPPSLTDTPTVDRMMFISFVAGNNITSWTPSAGQTEYFDETVVAGLNQASAGSYKLSKGLADVTLSWTTDPGICEHALLGIKPITGAGNTEAPTHIESPTHY